MSRRAARAAALQALFQIDMAGSGMQDAIAFTQEENNLNEKQMEYVYSTVNGALANLKRIDGIIAEISIDWELERMAAVDRNALRLALYEMCYAEDVPPNVAVNEAIELGKMFGSAESGRFINGILGKALENIDKYKVAGSIGV